MAGALNVVILAAGEGTADAARLACGQAVEPILDPVPEADPVVALEGGTLVAIGIGRSGVLKPRKVFR